MKRLPTINCCTPLAGSSLSDDDAIELEKLFRVLADRNRLKILNILLRAQGAAVCVCEFTDQLDLAQPTGELSPQTAPRGSRCNRRAAGAWSTGHGARAAVSPARRAAYLVVLRVFEDDAYADRAFASAATGLDARDRALAQQIAYGTVQRVRMLDHAIETLGRRPVRKLDPPVRAALRLGAYQLAYLDGVPAHAAVNESVELVRAARLERAVPFTNAVMRRLAEGLAALLASLPEGPLKAFVPRLDLRDVATRLGRGRGAGADAGPERGPRDRRPARRAARSRASRPTCRAPGASRGSTSVRSARAGSGRRAAARSSPGSPSAPGRASACSTSAPRPAARRRCSRGEVVAVELHGGRARELEENARRLGADNVRVVNADGLALPPELDGLRLRARRRALLRASACSPAGPTCAGARSRCRSSSSRSLRAAAERVRPGGTVIFSVCTLNADENEAVVDASGLAAVDLGAEWPAFRHPKRPEFLLTMPHRHGTSGFFVARLLVGNATSSLRSPVGWDDWIRTVEVEPSLYAADFSQLGHESTCCSARAPGSSTSTSATRTSSSPSRWGRSCSSRSRR